MSIYDIVMHFYQMLDILAKQGVYIKWLMGANLLVALSNLAALLLILRKLNKG